ncbi:PAR14 polymerase, partial [Nothoprocta pentlandii]|nr:PAR14 polymerase [Nothoprocta pentlandii]
STKISPLVALENVQHLSTEGLCRLLENASGFRVHEDFRVEMIPEKSTAVLSLLKSIDAQEFVKFCAESKQLQKFKITARLLELTPSIKAENIPAGISTDHITEYFENVGDGAGPVVHVQLLPEERSAIIIFCNPKGKA